MMEWLPGVSPLLVVLGLLVFLYIEGWNQLCNLRDWLKKRRTKT